MTPHIIEETAATDAFAKDAIAFTDTCSRFYADLAARIRRETITAKPLEIAGMVQMADHYQARAHALKAFGHAVGCYPTMAMLGRMYKVAM